MGIVNPADMNSSPQSASRFYHGMDDSSSEEQPSVHIGTFGTITGVYGRVILPNKKEYTLFWKYDGLKNACPEDVSKGQRVAFVERMEKKNRNYKKVWRPLIQEAVLLGNENSFPPGVYEQERIGLSGNTCIMYSVEGALRFLSGTLACDSETENAELERSRGSSQGSSGRSSDSIEDINRQQILHTWSPPVVLKQPYSGYLARRGTQIPRNHNSMDRHSMGMSLGHIGRYSNSAAVPNNMGLYNTPVLIQPQRSTYPSRLPTSFTSSADDFNSRNVRSQVPSQAGRTRTSPRAVHHPLQELLGMPPQSPRGSAKPVGPGALEPAKDDRIQVFSPVGEASFPSHIPTGVRARSAPLSGREWVKSWLDRGGMGEYLDAFVAAGYCQPEAVENLDDGDFDALGVSKRGHRKVLRKLADQAAQVSRVA